MWVLQILVAQFTQNCEQMYDFIFKMLQIAHIGTK